MIDLSKQYAFGNITSLGQGLGFLVGPAFMIAGVAVVIYFIIGAVRFIFSAGDKGAVQGARDMITHAIIGFILLMLMFLLFQFIPEFLGLGKFKIIQ